MHFRTLPRRNIRTKLTGLPRLELVLRSCCSRLLVRARALRREPSEHCGGAAAARGARRGGGARGGGAVVMAAVAAGCDA